MAGLISFFTLLARLIDLAVRLGDQMREQRLDEWIESIDESMKKLEAAKTPEEKRDAALSISRVIARRRPSS